MQKRNIQTVIVAAIAIGALSLGGCATKGFVRAQVNSEDTKVRATQDQ